MFKRQKRQKVTDAAGKPTIYDAIGGEDALVKVVDDFYRRVVDDGQLAGFFAGVNMTKLQGRQVEFFAAALGGPHTYTGASMRQAHQGRGIGQAHFDLVALHLTESLRAAGVPGELVDQIIGAVAPLAAEIVSSGAR
jgi:hemoglobin